MKKDDLKKCLLAGLAAGAVLATATPVEAVISEVELNSALAFGGSSNCSGKSGCAGGNSNYSYSPKGSCAGAQPVVYGSGPVPATCAGARPVHYGSAPVSASCAGGTQPSYYAGQPVDSSSRAYGQPASTGIYYNQPQGNFSAGSQHAQQPATSSMAQPQTQWSNTSTQANFDNRAWGNSGLKDAAPGSQTQWNHPSSSSFNIGQPNQSNFDQNQNLNLQPKDANSSNNPSSSNTRR